MKTIEIFDAVVPDAQRVSAAQENEQRYQSSTQFVKTGVTGNPQIFVEMSSDNANWDILPNPDTGQDFTLFDDTSISIVLLEMPAKFLRFRMEPNGATGGTVSADMSQNEIS